MAVDSVSVNLRMTINQQHANDSAEQQRDPRTNIRLREVLES